MKILLPIVILVAALLGVNIVMAIAMERPASAAQPAAQPEPAASLPARNLIDQT